MRDMTNCTVQWNSSMDRRLTTLQTTVSRLTEQGQYPATAINDLYLFRREAVTPPESVMYEPSVCVLVQGAKRVFPGDQSFVYDSHHFLVASVDIPTVVQVIKATPEKPCLGVVLEIDRREVSQLMLDSHLPAPRTNRSGLGISTGALSEPLLDAVGRLVSLLESPQDIPILAPMIKREILYRLLLGEQGVRLWQIATAGSQSHQISQAIRWLKNNYDQPMRIDDLASRVNMSTSTFHHYFRAITSKSPLQFQKWLRLNEARRLMLVERLDVSNAAFEVGYESPSQFSRDYSRLFGDSPRRDISALRRKVDAAPD